MLLRFLVAAKITRCCAGWLNSFKDAMESLWKRRCMGCPGRKQVFLHSISMREKAVPVRVFHIRVVILIPEILCIQDTQGICRPFGEILEKPILCF